MKNMKWLLIILLTALLPAAAQAQAKLVPNKITLKSGKTFDLNLPADLEIIPALEGLKRVRFFAKAPDGRIFVTDMYNLTDNKRGTVYILDGWNAKTGQFTKAIPYMTTCAIRTACSFTAILRDRIGSIWQRPTN